MSACVWELKGSEVNEATTAGTFVGSSRPACGPEIVPGPLHEVGSIGTTGPVERISDFLSEGNTFGNLAKNLFSMFEDLEKSCKVWRSKVKFSGGVFPLPECPRAIQEVLGQMSEDELTVLRCVAKALNSYSGVNAADRPLASSSARMALKSLAKTIRDSGLCQQKFEGVSWESLMKVKTVDYRGEEVQVAKRIPLGEH
eukprot:s1332_g3.t1